MQRFLRANLIGRCFLLRRLVRQMRGEMKMSKKSITVHILNNTLAVLFAILMLIAAVPLACTEVHAANNSAVEISQEGCVLTITKNYMRQEIIGGSTVLFYDFYMAGYDDGQSHYYSWINNGDAVTVSSSYGYYPSYTRDQLFNQFSSMYTSNLAAGAVSNYNSFSNYPKYNWTGSESVRDENCTGYYFFVQASTDAQNINLTFDYHDYTEYFGQNPETGMWEAGEICTKCGEKRDIIPIHRWDDIPGEYTVKTDDLTLLYEDQLYYAFSIAPTDNRILEFNKSDSFNDVYMEIGSGYEEDPSSGGLWDVVGYYGNADSLGGDSDKTSYEYEIFAGESYLILINKDLRYGNSFGEDLTISITNAPERFTSQDGLWEYNIENDQAYLRKWLGTGDTITYPRTIDGYTVRQVRAKGTYTEEQMNAIKHVIFEMGTIETAENDDYLEPADSSYYMSSHFDYFPYDGFEDVTMHSQGYIDSHSRLFNINYYSSNKFICACEYETVGEHPRTCSEYGYIEHRCTICNDEYKEQTENPTWQHKYTIPLKEIYPCSDEYMEFKCETCDRTTWGYPSNPEPHTWVPDVEVPSCTSGFYDCTCSVCGKKYEEKYFSATSDHSWKVIEEVPTTCQYGYKEYECEYCGRTEKEYDWNSTILDHNYIHKHEPASCGYACDYDECEYCGRLINLEYDYDSTPDPTIEHDWEVYRVVAEPACSSSGFYPGVKLVRCKICKAEDMISTYPEHKEMVPQINTDEVPCGESVYCEYKCSLCGFSQSDYYTAPDHDLVFLEHEDPTCLHMGYDKYHCNRCEQEITNYIPVLGDIYGHIYDFSDREYGQRYGCIKCDETLSILVDVNNDETTWVDINEFVDEIQADFKDDVTSVFLRYEAKYDTQIIKCKDGEGNQENKLPVYYDFINTAERYGIPGYINPRIEDRVFELNVKQGGTYVAHIEDWKNAGLFRTDHDHITDMSTLVEENPTCTEDGYREWDCKHCGKHYHEDIKGTAVGGGNDHIWGAWKTVKAATVDVTGKQERVCSVCSEKESKTIPKLDLPKDSGSTSSGGTGTSAGTSTGTKPASGTSSKASGTVVAVKPAKENPAATKTNVVTKVKTVVKTPDFGTLRLLSKKQTEKTIKLEWTKVPGATKYTIYGTPCGSGNKAVKIASVKGNTYTVKKVNKKALKKGTYYNFKVVAEKDGKTVGISKQIHVSTLGNKKKGNYSSVNVSNTLIKTAKNLKKGKTLSLKANATPIKGYKIKNHEGLRYESTNPKIATVSSSGKVKGIKKGTCYIYVYAQNGVFKKIKITVK